MMSHGDWKHMFRAIKDNDIELVRYYIKSGIDINYQHPEYMTNALCESIRLKNPDMINLLINHGASTDIKEMDSGKTPLQIAEDLQFNAAIKLIQKSGGQSSVDFHNFTKSINPNMKASLCTQYGPPEVIEIREVKTPKPKNNQILVKIMSSTLNSGDVRVRGLQVEGIMKLIMKLVVGWTKPRKPILGVTFSGMVTEVGKDVTKFTAGDKVYGLTAFNFGYHAEYNVVNENSMVSHMPKNAHFDDAAAILFGGQTAVSFLHKMGIQTNKNLKFMILGGSGAVGTSSIQLAKYYGAHVTAVCSSENKDLCISLGADTVICYDQESIESATDRFDIVFDAVGKYTKKQCKHLLATHGVFKTVGGMEYASESLDQLQLLTKMYTEGKLKPVIDKVYSLNDIVNAHTYVDTGKKKGNVVIKIE
jgi:NADPH:quinone reductase-like Zn-dependent oxidoreductase